MRKNAMEANPKYKEMIALFKQGKTLREVGEAFGVSRQRVAEVFGRLGVRSDEGGIAVRPKKVYEKKPPRIERICSVEGCGRKHEAKGLCNPHYMRVLLTGKVGGAEIGKYKRKKGVGL